MKCPKCEMRIHGDNKKKVHGQWVHKKCPPKQLLPQTHEKEIEKEYIV